jgi:hypothetical protein
MDNETINGLKQVINGEIDNPELEIEIDGSVKIFKGEDAVIFATGILTGVAMMKGESSYTDNVSRD